MLLIKKTECSGKYMCTRDVYTGFEFLKSEHIFILFKCFVHNFFEEWKDVFILKVVFCCDLFFKNWVFKKEGGSTESMWPKRGFIKWSCLTIWGEGDQKFQKNGHVVYVWPLMIIIWWLILILCKLYSRLVYQAYQAASIYSFFGNWKSPKLTMHWLHA